MQNTPTIEFALDHDNAAMLETALSMAGVPNSEESFSALMNNAMRDFLPKVISGEIKIEGA